MLVSRLTLKFDRAAAAYGPPAAPVPMETLRAIVTPLIGYDNFGYWGFFGNEDAGPALNKHVSFALDFQDQALTQWM